MTQRDIFTDVAAILCPLPQPARGEEHDDGLLAAHDQAAEEQENIVWNLRMAWEGDDQDPLIGSLAGARRAKEQAEQRIRQLIAYSREFVQPRPYTLNDVAAAAGMSISGVRTAYGHRDVAQVAEATGAKPREWRAPDASV